MKRGAIDLLALGFFVLITILVPVTVKLVQQSQETRTKAYVPCDPGDCPNGCNRDGSCKEPSPSLPPPDNNPPPNNPPPNNNPPAAVLCTDADCPMGGTSCRQDGGTCSGTKPNCSCVYPSPTPTPTPTPVQSTTYLNCGAGSCGASPGEGWLCVANYQQGQCTWQQPPGNWQNWKCVGGGNCDQCGVGNNGWSWWGDGCKDWCANHANEPNCQRAAGGVSGPLVTCGNNLNTCSRPGPDILDTHSTS